MEDAVEGRERRWKEKEEEARLKRMEIENERVKQETKVKGLEKEGGDGDSKVDPAGSRRGVGEGDLSVVIPVSLKVTDSNGSIYTSYDIRVVRTLRPSEIVVRGRRRYREFASFRQLISEEGGAEVVEFPGKGGWGRLGEDGVEERRKDLERWCNGLGAERVKGWMEEEEGGG